MDNPFLFSVVRVELVSVGYTLHAVSRGGSDQHSKTQGRKGLGWHPWRTVATCLGRGKLGWMTARIRRENEVENRPCLPDAPGPKLEPHFLPAAYELVLNRKYN